MILSKQELERQITTGRIGITPLVPRFFTENGIDLHLSHNLFILAPEFDGDVIDPKEDVRHFFKPYTMTTDGGYVLNPGTFVLGVTVEHTHVPNHVPIMEGNSTNGRMGLETHICAGMGDKGFSGHWTVEMRATRPIRIYPGMPVGQLVFFMVNGDGNEDYGAKAVNYNNEFSAAPWPVLPNLHMKPQKFFDFEKDWNQ